MPLHLYKLIMGDLLRRRREDGELDQRIEAAYATALNDCHDEMTDAEREEIEKLFSAPDEST